MEARRTGRIARAAAALVGVLVMTGCQARVETALFVGGGAAKAEVRVSLEGQDLELDPVQVQRLAEVMTKRAGSKAKVGDDGHVVSVSVGADGLGAHRALTGVKSVTVTELEDGWNKVAVEIVVPNELIAAVAESVEGEPDADALREAALGVTEYGVSIGFGEVREATFVTSSGSEEATVRNGGVSWSSDLAEPRTGVLVVEGRSGEGQGVKIWAVIAAVVLLVVIAVGVRRSR